jgi:hypothetical protein
MKSSRRRFTNRQPRRKLIGRGGRPQLGRRPGPPRDEFRPIGYNTGMAAEIEDPAEFGWDKWGKSYTPSPEEIAQRCEEIRATWPSREERSRRQWSAEREELITHHVDDRDTRR